MPRIPGFLAAVLGSRPAPPVPLPVPPPALTVAPRPPYRECTACGCGGRGDNCWYCPPSQPSQLEETTHD